MNRIELAAGHATSLVPLRGDPAVAPVACTPTLGIFFAAASFSYITNRNHNSAYIGDGETDLVGNGLSLDQLTGDQLIAARRAQSSH